MQNAFWEAHIRSADQEIARLLWNKKVNHRENLGYAAM